MQFIIKYIIIFKYFTLTHNAAVLVTAVTQQFIEVPELNSHMKPQGTDIRKIHKIAESMLASVL